MLSGSECDIKGGSTGRRSVTLGEGSANARTTKPGSGAGLDGCLALRCNLPVTESWVVEQSLGPLPVGTEANRPTS